MMKFVLYFLITVFLSACGVDTSSSSTGSNIVVQADSDILTDSDLVVSDPIDSNPVVSGSDSDDPDSDDPDSDDPDSDDPDSDDPDSDDPTVNPNDSNFDTKDAIEDPNACDTNTHRSTRDASYGGEDESENGASSSIVNGQGLVIRSEYLSQDHLSTWVTLFHKGFPTPSDLDVQGVTSFKLKDVFYLSYDLAWADESIPNIDNRVYIQSDKGIKPACYRLDLNSINGDELEVQKVYRLRL